MRLLGFLIGAVAVFTIFASDAQKARMHALAGAGLEWIAARVREVRSGSMDANGPRHALQRPEAGREAGPEGASPPASHAPQVPTRPPAPVAENRSPDDPTSANDAESAHPVIPAMDASGGTASASVASATRLVPFWGPFTVRSAALGFAARVQAASGVPVEVLESRGGYQAALRVHDDAELQAALEQIERSTGLRLMDPEAHHAGP